MTRVSNRNRSIVAAENEAVVRYLFERVYSKGELHRIDDVVTSDFAGYGPESDYVSLGPDGIRAHVIRLRTAFDGFTVEIQDLFVADDGFEVSWIATGTHERRFQDVEPTGTTGHIGEEPHGNRIAISGATSGTFRDGKIHELRTAWDVSDLRRQLMRTVEDTEADIDDWAPAGQETLLEGNRGIAMPTIHTMSGPGGR